MNIKQYSIAEARARLAGIVQAVGRGVRVELTRRGKPVAIVVSVAEYERISNGSTTFEKAFEEFRKRVDLQALGISPDLFLGLRERSPGREVRV